MVKNCVLDGLGMGYSATINEQSLGTQVTLDLLCSLLKLCYIPFTLTSMYKDAFTHPLK